MLLEQGGVGRLEEVDLCERWAAWGRLGLDKFVMMR